MFQKVSFSLSMLHAMRYGAQLFLVGGILDTLVTSVEAAFSSAVFVGLLML